MKKYDKLKELVEKELSEYSYFEGWDIKFEEEYKDYEYYNLETKMNDVHFRVSDDKIEVELSEDSYYEIKYFDWTIKYFWMAILSWD